MRLKIKGALGVQQELENLYWEAKQKGDVKQAAFVLQTWISAEKYASIERLNKKGKKTALDKLCEILQEQRKIYEKEINNEQLQK